MTQDEAFETFLDPPREFGIIPFWFWNDDLEETELIRQLRAFHDAGFGGVMPHARIGLSHRVGYLTDEYFRLIKVVVDEAARLGMKVILYDEGSYPSGSANGAVVAENPEFASRSIRLLEHEVVGPTVEFWRPNTGRALMDQHVTTVVGKVDRSDRVDPASLRILEPEAHDVIRVEVPEGRWKVMSVWNVASGGVIRGVFPESEDGHSTAPPSGDILNPEAVACFIRLTHDRYHETLKEHFTSTVIGMFTDEPSVMGRGGRRRGQGRPYTPGFAEWLSDQWGEDPRPWLPALWCDYGDGTEAFRQRYSDAVQVRLHDVFYAAQAEWCAAHGIELTGHPAESDDLSSLRLFQLPGQDMVWRYVEPNKPSALEGEHSVAAKVATSGARLSDRRRVLTEVCGAYGWHLTLDEVKWLFDWHMVRGNNLINPHAVFYSIRGRRAWESEPDLALHNVWWPYFKQIAEYTRRICWLLTDGEHVCDVAILGDGHRVPWEAARKLYERQIDFLYLDDRAVQDAEVVGASLRVGSQTYRVVVIDGSPELSGQAQEKLDDFKKSGGTVIDAGESEAVVAAIDAVVDPDLRVVPPCPDLRAIHYRKGNLDHYLLVNEGEGPVSGSVSTSVAGRAQLWDALKGEREPADSRKDGDRLQTSIVLGRRESVVLTIDASETPTEQHEGEEWTVERIDVDANWSVTQPNGKTVGIEPGDWSRHKGRELFSGTLVYRSDLDVPEGDRIELDLGRVGDIAEVFVDGVSVGSRMWAPYQFRLADVAPGTHDFEIHVTNSMANAYDGKQMASGLIGPVSVVVRRQRG